MPTAAPRATFTVPPSFTATLMTGEAALGARERAIPFALVLPRPGVLAAGEDVRAVVVQVLDSPWDGTTPTDVTPQLLVGALSWTDEDTQVTVQWTLGDANATPGHRYLAMVDVLTTLGRTVQAACGPLSCPLSSGLVPLLDDPGA